MATENNIGSKSSQDIQSISGRFTEKMIRPGIFLLIFLIPFQIYFNFYENLSISVAQIVGILLIGLTAYRCWHEDRCRHLDSRDWAVWLFIVAMMLSIAVSQHKLNSLKYFVKWTSSTMLFFVVSRDCRTVNDIRKYLYAAILASAMVACLGIFEYFAGYQRVIDWFNSSRLPAIVMEPDTIREKLADHSFNWTIWGANSLGLRAFGTFECAIAFSAFLGLFVPFVPWLLKLQKLKLLNLIMSLILLVTIFLSYTRSAYLSGICVMLLFLFLAIKKVNIRRVILISSVFVVMLISLVAFYAPVRSDFGTRISWKTPSYRATLWKQGLRIAAAVPVLGTGIAEYQSGLQKYCEKDSMQLPAHSNYLQIAAENGFVGLIAYLSLLVLMLSASRTIVSRADNKDMMYLGLGFTGLWLWFVVQSFFESYLFGDKFTMMFWLMLGLNASLYRVHASAPVKA